MVDKVKSLNWNLFSKVFIIFANISILYCIIAMVLNTKNVENSTIVVFYLIIGIATLFLMRISNATFKEINE